EGEGGGTLARHWRALDAHDGWSWRGLGVALAVAAVLASAIVLAWPGLVDGDARWLLAGFAALAWPLLHLVPVRTPLPATGLDVVDMPEPVQPAAVDAAPEDADPTAALYAAARGGRVERALALLDDGADPHALPDPGSRDQRALAVLAAVLPDLRLLRTLIARGIDLNQAH